MIFTSILFTEEEGGGNGLHFLLQSSKEELQFSFPWTCYQRNTRHLHGNQHMKEQDFSSFSVFLLLVADLCLQLERFARNKCYDKTLWVDKSPRLICLYSTKHANTHRSTALGESPLIWFCARHQNPPIPRSLDGRGCGVQRGSVHVCVLGITRQYLLLPFEFPPPSPPDSFRWGTGENPSFGEGLKI